MKFSIYSLVIFIFTALSSSAMAQDFAEVIARHREAYKADFLKTANSPLKEADLEYLRFFTPDSAYRLAAEFVAAPCSEPFEMLTYSGQRKPYVKYGELHFVLAGEKQTLDVY